MTPFTGQAITEQPARTIVRWLIPLSMVSLGGALLGLVYGWQLTLVPLVLVGVLVVLSSPLAGVYILVFTMMFKTPIPGSVGIYPGDILSFLVIASCVIHRLASGQSPVRSSRLNYLLLATLVVFALTLLGAYNIRSGVVNLGRHIQLFALLVAVSSCVEKDDIPRLLNWLLLLVGVLSVGNIAMAVSVGGRARIFGPAGAFFAVFTVVCAIHASIRFLLSRDSLHRAGWGLVVLVLTAALIFTQTRAAWIQLLLSLVFLLSILYWWSRLQGHRGIRRRIVVIAIVFTLIGVVVVTGALPVFQRPAARIAEVVEGHATTVGYRLFLWQLGLQAFLKHPIGGIGLGQIGEWHNFMPAWRFYLHAPTVHRLGAHNDFITYLAETGVPGTLLILAIFWQLFRMGVARFRRLEEIDAASRLLVLWAPAVGLMIGFFFSTHLLYSIPGMLTALYFGLLLVETETAAPPARPAKNPVFGNV